MISSAVQRMSRPIRLTVTIGGLLVATVMLSWYFWPTPSLDAQARSVVLACFDGDVDLLSPRTVEEMFPETGVTEFGARDVINKIVIPEFAQCTLKKEEGALNMDRFVMGTWSYVLATKKGDEVLLAVQVHGTGAEGKYSLLALIKDAWLIRYIERHGELPTDPAMAWVEGYEADKSTLKRAGMRGTWDSLNDRLWNWDQLSNNWKAQRNPL